MKRNVLRISLFVLCGLTVLFSGVVIGMKNENKMQKNKIGGEIAQLKSKKNTIERRLKKDVEKSDKIDNQISDDSKKLSTIRLKFRNMESEFKNAKELVNKKDEIEKDLDAKKSKLKDIETKLADQRKELKSLQAKVIFVSGKLQKAEEAPKSLIAGQYIVGKDLPKGRYKATNIGRGSNFFVYDSDGNVVVNTILGNSKIGNGDYVFYCDDGWFIETHASVKLIPIK